MLGGHKPDGASQSWRLPVNPSRHQRQRAARALLDLSQARFTHCLLARPIEPTRERLGPEEILARRAGRLSASTILRANQDPEEHHCQWVRFRRFLGLVSVHEKEWALQMAEEWG